MILRLELELGQTGTVFGPTEVPFHDSGICPEVWSARDTGGNGSGVSRDRRWWADRDSVGSELRRGRRP